MLQQGPASYGGVSNLGSTVGYGAPQYTQS
jgi:hypothetical protein